VKIYETMKPKDAARIFEQLDMPVLLGVLERMKEMKSSAILAAMDASKAKAATMALAERHAPPPAK
jgi:flagellar motility protein MotE (MotC chaperone)